MGRRDASRQVLVVLTATVLVCAWFGTGRAGASTDSSPPQLASLSLSPPGIDVSSGDVAVTVTLRATDDSSGVVSGCLGFDKPNSTVGYTGNCFDASNRIGGTALNGLYSFSVVFKQYAHNGIYPVSELTLVDAAGNQAVIPGAVLEFAGLPYFESVSGVSDTTAPGVVSVSLSNTTGDLAAGDFTTTITAHVTDDLSGIDAGCIAFGTPQNPNSAADQSCFLEPDHRVSGTKLNGVYQSTLTIPHSSSPGVYPLFNLVLQDRSGNLLTVAPATLISDGAPAALTLTNSDDLVPSSPGGASATAGDASATVSWSPSASDGGAPILGYVVTASPGGQTAAAGPTQTSATVSGLSNDTSYSFAVHARNGIGNSVESPASNVVVPGALPLPPTNVVAVAGAGQAQVSWTASVPNGGPPITGYTVIETPVDDYGCGPGGPICQTATVAAAATTATVGGLLNAKGYTFTVHATNSIGNSPESAPSAAVTTAPGTSTPPQFLSGIAQDGAVLLQWALPVNAGGAAAISYTITASPGGQTLTVPAGPAHDATFSGLTNGNTYTFTMHSTNAYGDSAESDTSNAVVPYGPPGAPGSVTAVAGNGTATVSWTVPSANGAAITHYYVSAAPGFAVGGADAPQTSATVSGLTNGVTYTFNVVAANAAGGGATSVSSAPITVGAPAPPVAPTVASSDTKAILSWNAPASNGSPVTAYVITPFVGYFPLAAQTFASAATTATVTGLTNGTTYRFTIAAKNANGTGTTTLTAPVKVGAPAAPTAPAVIPGNTTATVSWTPPANPVGAPVTSYVITPYAGYFALAAQTFPSTASSASVVGLTNGTSYRFAIVAKNSVGASVAAMSAATVEGAPVAPSGVITRSGSTTATTGPLSVVFTAGANNGAPITKFTASCVSGNGGVTVAGTYVGATSGTIAVAGAATGKSYACTVTATNSRGTSAPSAPSPSTIVGAPAAPGAPVVTKAGAGSLRVTFVVPANNGASIVGYVASCRSTNGGVTASKSGTSSPIVVTGLTTTKTYTCTVTASNSRGSGRGSPASAGVIA